MKDNTNLPLVSVIISNYNGKKYLKNCFESLLSQTYLNIELIMADAPSTDGSAEYVKESFPRVVLSVGEKDLGLADMSNRGAKLAKGKYLLFYNNDTISFPNFIEEMVKVVEKDPKIGLVCPVQFPYLPEDDAKMTDAQKDIGVGSDMYGYICTAKDAGHIFYPDAAIFIPKDLFDKIGGFDSNFNMYGEDMDLCWRVHLLGYKIEAAPEAKFRHDSFCAQKSGDGKVITSYRRRNMVERQVINKLFKYYTLGTLLKILPKFIMYYLAESLFFLIVRRDWKMFRQVYIEAILWNLNKVKSTLENRKYIQSIRTVDDKYITGLMYPKYRKLEAAMILGIPHVK